MKKRLPWEMVPTILALAGPTMLEQLMQTTVQYIDTAMVGTLGTEATAAVGATSTVNWLVSSTITALGIGFLSIIAKALGAGDAERARKASAQSVLAVLFAGILYTILTVSLSSKVPVWMQVDPSLQKIAARYFLILYAPMLPRAASLIFGTVLRAAGDSKTPMRVGIVVNLTNVVLNFLLIYPKRTVRILGKAFVMWGAGRGVIGAAEASAIAYAVGGVVITAALLRHPKISPLGYSLRPDAGILKPCLRVAIPYMLQRFGTSMGYVVFASMINALGEISTAAHTIANTIESAFYIPGYGMQAATATLAGNAYGAGDNARMHQLTRMVILIEATLMIVSGGLLFAFAPLMVSLFSSNEEVIVLGSLVLRMVALSEPFFGVSIVIEGMLQGTGNTLVPFLVNIIGMWGIRIIGTWILTNLLHGGLSLAWGCMIAHNMLMFCCFVIYYLRGNWNPLEHRQAAAAN